MMKVTDNVAVSQTIDQTGGQQLEHSHTYHDGFKGSPGPMSGADMHMYKSQYPSLPMMSPNKGGHSGSMDHISGDMTEASRSPSKLAT